MKHRIGIIGAMPQELAAVVALIEGVEVVEKGNRQYFVGELFGSPVVAAYSRSGKVAAAITVCTLLLDFDVKEVIFTGVAGAVSQQRHIGDVVVGSRLIQHDVDARPVMPRFEIPLLGITYFETNAARSQQAVAATQVFLAERLPAALKQRFHLRHPEVVQGDIASGDQFIASDASRQQLREVLPDIECVEMEGAAVAQVCYEHGIPFTVIRTISDAADDDATVNFLSFIEEVASLYAVEIIRGMLLGKE
jgi:adenosylhomocysteine nucleosidase